MVALLVKHQQKKQWLSIGTTEGLSIEIELQNFKRTKILSYMPNFAPLLWNKNINSCYKRDEDYFKKNI